MALPRYNLTKFKDKEGKDIIVIGCEYHEVSWWKEHGEELAKKNNFAPDDIELYRKIVNLF